MIHIIREEQCCGCTACEAICPVDAITMKQDQQGFRYPHINSEICVKCNLCEKVCPFHEKDTQNLPKKIYGGIIADRLSESKSQSGGLAFCLAENFIRDSGCIYGVAFDENFEVRHFRATTLTEIEPFRKSKYVQSNLSGIFSQIAKDLSAGRKVLFFGVGCQVAGLVSYCKLKHLDTTSLTTVDIICHGVTSPLYWDDYLKLIRKRLKSDIIAYSFRDKEPYGWNSSQSSISLASGKKIFPNRNFYHSLLFRRSCNVCHFTNLSRVSDITLGDFWGVEQSHPEIDISNRGVSLILVNTTKGEQLLDEVKEQLILFESTAEKCMQPQLKGPTPIHPLKSEWEQEYLNFGFEKAIKHLDIVITPSPWKSLLKSIPMRIKKLIKHFGTK